jgi:inhibitor of KinA sporulation pathway (predicted exonuclease)
VQFVSIDLELAQPSNRIIELGAWFCDTDSADVIISRYASYVNPGHPYNPHAELRSGAGTMGDLCPHLTSERLAAAPDWSQVSMNFAIWLAQFSCKRLVQWGRGDWDCILRETQQVGHGGLFGRRQVINAKQLYQMFHRNKSGLKDAAAHLCPDVNFVAHQADQDALATAMVFAAMYKTYKLGCKVKELV